MPQQCSVPLIAAVSDVHSPRHLLEFVAALGRHVDECRCVKLFLLAGDMVERGNVSALKPVLAAIGQYCSMARIVATFGNEEYMDRESLFIRRYPQVVWLNDSYMTFEYGDARIAVYGTRGAIDKPTRWQLRHIPGIRRIYAERVRRLRENILLLKKKGYRIIVLTHYAPTRLTIEGEDPQIWPYLASTEMEKVIEETQPDIVIHGHAHHAKRLEAVLGETRIYNVAFPARKDILIIPAPMSKGRLY